jgi:AcrR family transcriptional regulator
MSRKVEQGDATRRELVDAAIALFTEYGFADTSTTQIVRRANVTRGALYHHFADKERLFEAAFIEIEKNIFTRCVVASAAVGDDPLAQMRAGIDAFLDACLEPRVQRILLLEGPSVLGWERSLRFDDPYCARRLLRAAVTGAVQAGLLPQGPAEPLTHVLYGALNQAGIVITGAADPVTERAAMGKALGDLVDSLFRR